jgi:hypothetical protein
MNPVPSIAPNPKKTSNGNLIAPEFASGLISNMTKAGRDTTSMMVPKRIGMKSPLSPRTIDHFGHFIRAFLNLV